MTTVTLGAPASLTDQLAALPCSVTVSRATLEQAAASCRVALPWQGPRARAERALAQALGGERAAPPGADTGAGDPDPAVVAALLAFADADVVVDLDLAAHRARGPRDSAQLRAWHRLSGGRVTTVTYAGGDLVELGWFGSSSWQQVLSRLVPDEHLPGEEPAPRPGLVMPLPLWLGSGEALRSGHPDLLTRLLDRHRGLVLDPSGEPLAAAESERQVRLVHESVQARIRGVVAASGRRRLGLVSWLRYADGWRSLTPVAGAGGPAVRLDPVSPPRLGAEIARLAAGARS